ncbi:hypothetical protein MGL_0472 [Malassezia globosa CBS 7966]|uniref:RING-type domain-containing protein n=1 Tax=Malassezia globosa (strain ATCC MYA-4612 / CBS 7966) TaxID=425265 RepID=A8PTS7_MALGO|nr:uncharacterized protein MGL_0472 [Malassezia globosa CBS 7966]EDP45483.1 hypothetical protein MGL_0472 [Malassezia globosa CBS 7966]
MTRHSKQNTALGHFTYAEYQMLKDRWGSRSLRLSKENMRAFYACYLCLQAAQQPVCCGEGHLFCKKRALADHAQRRSDRARIAADKAAEAYEREAKNRVAAFARNDGPVSWQTTNNGKRKHDDDDGGGSAEKRASMHKGSESLAPSSTSASSHTAMPAFWLPSMAPEVSREEQEKAQAALDDERPSTTLCTATSDKPHKLLSKHLIPVHFSVRKIEQEEQMYCPCCKKEFSLVSRTNVLRPCGHVLCASCTTTLVTTPLSHGEPVSCPECSRVIPKTRDVIPLVREGTGYASGGATEAHARGIAFQG